MKFPALSSLRRLLVGALFACSPALAAPVLQITPITWNVIGLDSNNVNVGPSRYPVGARVCNVGSSAATNVRASISLDGGTTNPYISVYGQTSLTVASLAAGSAPTTTPYQQSGTPANCQDFYFLVDVARNSNAYSSRVSDTATPAQRNTQLYHIEATADGLGTVSTPAGRELYVEKLISQGRNSIAQFSGPSNVLVGGTYTYTLSGNTAPGGYEQLEVFPLFPNTIFQILSVSTTYTAPAAGVNSTVYADACGWENNRTSTSYHNNLTCIGPANYAGGKAGDSISTRVTVKILSAGTATIQSTITDFSGSSYHYNADFGDAVNAFTVTATNPVSGPDLLISKTHSSMSVKSTGTYTLGVSNGGGSATSGTVTVVDTLPDGLNPTAASGTGWSCTVRAATNSVQGSVTCTRGDALAAGASYPNISIATTVTATKPGPVTNVAEVSGGGDTNTANNKAYDPTVITASVNLNVTKTGPTSVVNGSSVSYTVTVTNPNGSADANGAILSDPAVSGFTATGVTCAAGNNKAVCPATPDLTVANLQSGLTIPTLTTGGILTFTVTGTAVGNSSGTIRNTAIISPPSGYADTSTADNTATVTTTITPVSVNIGVTKGNPSVVTGNTVTYTIVASNPTTGSGDASGATLKDPAVSGFAATGLTCTSADTTLAVCPASLTVADFQAGMTLPTFKVGGSLTFVVTGTVSMNTAATVTNVVTLTAPYGTTDTATANNTASVTTPLVNLATTKAQSTPAPGPTVSAGATVSYTITASNPAGSGDASGATLRDPAVSGFTATSVTCTSANTTLAACPAGLTLAQFQAGVTLPTLKAGGSLTFVVTGTASMNAAAAITNTVTLTAPSGSLETDASDNTASATTRLNYVTFSKTVRNVTTGSAAGLAATGTPGQTLEYCLNFTNSAQFAVANVRITDPVPGATAAKLSAYGTGYGVQLTTGPTASIGSVTPTRLTSTAADSDGGSLSAAQLDVLVPSLGGSQTVLVCFQAAIR